MYEGKLRIPIRLKNRIEMLAKERKISFNKMVNIILELGIYELLEEEAEYGKIHTKLYGDWEPERKRNTNSVGSEINIKQSDFNK